MVSKLEQVMAREEGWYVLGSVPNRKNNPLDLRHSPHSSHDGEGPNDIGQIDTPADGWADGARQLEIYAQREMTIQEMIYEFAPPGDNNNTPGYLDFICENVPCNPTDLVSEVLTIPGDSDGQL